jgi:hypothetical protein
MQVHQVLALVKLLSEQIIYTFSLASSGGFLKSNLNYFEKCIDKTAVRPPGQDESENDGKDITQEEQYYTFSDHMEQDILALHAKIFANLMANQHSAKFIARTNLGSLRYAFMAYSAVMRGGQGVDESIGKDLMEGLGALLKQKEPIQLINKNTYIANWYYYRMYEVYL